jgi:S1-C subfamily serine protease
MERFAIIAGLLLGLAVATCSFAKAQDAITPEDLNRQIEQTNFIVGTGCSGTLVNLDEKLVLTNHHCIRPHVTSREVEITSPDGVVRKVKERRFLPVNLTQRRYVNFDFVGSSSYTAEIVVAIETADLAVLKINGPIPHTQAATFIPNGDPVIRGEKVYIVGNPSGLDATLAVSAVSSMNRKFATSWANDEQLPFMQVAGIWFGNSGGAVYNAKGQLVGIPTAVVGIAQLGLALPVQEVVKPRLRKECFARLFDPGAVEADKACVAEKRKVKAPVQP